MRITFGGASNSFANPVVGKRRERHQTHGGPEAVAHKPIARRGLELLQLTGRDRYSAGFRFLTAPISMPLTTCVARDKLANPACGMGRDWGTGKHGRT